MKYIYNISILWILTTSCVKIPIAKFEQYNNAAQGLNTTVSKTYQRIEKIQRRYIVVRAPDTAITSTTFLPLVHGISNDMKPSLTHRAAVLDLIAQYTNVLYIFASKDYGNNLDTASTKLAASMKTCSKTTLKEKSEASSLIGNAFGTLTDAVGKQLIDRKRLKVLKKTMDSAQKQLVILSGLLVHDHMLYSMALQQWRDALIRHANAIRPPYATLGRYEFDLEMANLLDEISAIEECLKISNEALTQLPKVSSEIRILLDKKDTKMEALQELVSEGQRLGNVYNNLNK